jgi:hypothetical protein
MKPASLFCLAALTLLTGCASTSQSNKFLQQARTVSVETQYQIQNVQGLNPALIRMQEQARWKAVQPSVQSYESGFLTTFKSLCNRAAEQKDVAPLYDYADTLRSQERLLKDLGQQKGLVLSPEVKLTNGVTMSIPDYVQQVARDAAPIIKNDADNALQNEKTSHFMSTLSNVMLIVSRLGRSYR